MAIFFHFITQRMEMTKKNAFFVKDLDHTHDELKAHMFKWRKESENMYGYPCGMWYTVSPFYKPLPYLRCCFPHVHDRKIMTAISRQDPFQGDVSFVNMDVDKEGDQMSQSVYNISYEEILASYLDLYGRRRHRISLLVRYPHTMEKEWTPLLKACALQASKAANFVIEPSMWRDPQLVLSVCKPAAIKAFLQCLPPELQTQMTVEVIYRRR